MNYKGLILFVILVGILISNSCISSSSSSPNSGEVTKMPISISSTTGPVLALTEKTKTSFSFPDVHILIDDSNSMTNKIQGNEEICDSDRTRDKIVFFFYRVIDDWRKDGLINSDQKTSIWLLNGSKDRYPNGPNITPDLLSWLERDGRGHSKFHGFVNIFSDLTDPEVVKDNSVVIFITDGDFRDGHPDASWRKHAETVASGVSKLHDRGIDVHFLLLCPNRLIDADLDGKGEFNSDDNDSDDYEMLTEWNSTIRGRGSFVYGIDADPNNNISLEQRHFTKKTVEVLRDILSKVISKYDTSGGIRLFTIKESEDIKSNLNAGIITQGLRDSFLQQGIYLSNTAKAYSMSSKDNLRWKIEDNVNYFVYQESEDSLGIYNAVNWALVDIGKEIEADIPPYALFLEKSQSFYESDGNNDNEKNLFNLDDKSSWMYYLHPDKQEGEKDYIPCNMSHRIHVSNVQEPFLLSWQYQPIDFVVENKEVPVVFYNDEPYFVSLQYKDDKTFDWESWMNCIMVDFTFDSKFTSPASYSDKRLSINTPSEVKQLYKNGEVQLTLYWTFSKEQRIQIGNPVSLSYEKRYVPIVAGQTYVNGTEMTLPYTFAVDETDTRLQPTLNFNTQCEFYQHNGYKFTNNLLNEIKFEWKNERYVVTFPQSEEAKTCNTMYVTWDDWPYKGTGDRIPENLSCDLKWDISGALDNTTRCDKDQ